MKKISTLQIKVDSDTLRKLRIKKILLDASTWTEFLEKLTEDVNL